MLLRPHPTSLAHLGLLAIMQTGSIPLKSLHLSSLPEGSLQHQEVCLAPSRYNPEVRGELTPLGTSITNEGRARVSESMPRSLDLHGSSFEACPPPRFSDGPQQGYVLQGPTARTAHCHQLLAFSSPRSTVPSAPWNHLPNKLPAQ